METSEILKKVRKIEIRTRGLSSNIFAGLYRSAFRGRGMTFSEVRAYQFGDDVRDIDWNVTARLNNPYVKVFEEERELTVMLLVDVSGSLNFGTTNQFKRDMAAEIEKYILPKKGRKHILYLVRELLEFQPESQQTDIKVAVEFLRKVIKRRCTAFLMSDFHYRSESFEDVLNICAQKHDTVAIQLYDHREKELPKVGLMNVIDAETGDTMCIDTNSKGVRRRYVSGWMEQQQVLKQILTRCKVDYVSISTGDDYVKSLMKLFNMRAY